MMINPLHNKNETAVIEVKFFTLLRLYLGLESVNIEADQLDVRTLLHKVRDQIDNDLILEKLLNPDGSMKTGTIILIDGSDVMDTDKLNTIVKKGDTVSLFPPGGGG
jgi:molybdopterin synthase sulfur carrier subunit